MAKFSTEEREQLARSVTEVDVDSEQAFFARLQRVLATPPPAVYVEYEQLKVVRNATTSASSLPSLPNVFLRLAKVCPTRAAAWTLPHAPQACMHVLRHGPMQCVHQIERLQVIHRGPCLSDSMCVSQLL